MAQESAFWPRGDFWVFFAAFRQKRGLENSNPISPQMPKNKINPRKYLQTVRLFRQSAFSGVKPRWPGESATPRAAPRLESRRDHVCFKAALSQGPGFAPRNSQEHPPTPQMARKRRWAGQFRAETLHYPPNRRSGPENV